jgi:hypothetical protein
VLRELRKLALDQRRAKFRTGPQVRPGEPHLVWPRVGTHAVLDEPAG